MLKFLLLLAAFLRSRENMSELEDIELIERYRTSHDSRYVGVLFQRYTHLLYGVSLKYLRDSDEAQDAVMQVFEKLLEHLKKHEIENFRGWLHMVCKNHCLMKLRKEQSQMKRSEAYEGDMKELVESDRRSMESDDFLHPNGEASDKEKQLVQLEEALKDLKGEQKHCLELFYLQGKSYQEVADETGYTLKQVKSHIQNGKRNLKISLEGKLNNE